MEFFCVRRYEYYSGRHYVNYANILVKQKYLCDNIADSRFMNFNDLLCKIVNIHKIGYVCAHFLIIVK